MRKGADKLTRMLNTKQQGRLDGFFAVKPKEAKPAPAPAKGTKGGKDAAKGTKRKVRARCVVPRSVANSRVIQAESSGVKKSRK